MIIILYEFSHTYMYTAAASLIPDRAGLFIFFNVQTWEGLGTRLTAVYLLYLFSYGH